MRLYYQRWRIRWRTTSCYLLLKHSNTTTDDDDDDDWGWAARCSSTFRHKHGSVLGTASKPQPARRASVAAPSGANAPISGRQSARYVVPVNTVSQLVPCRSPISRRPVTHDVWRMYISLSRTSVTTSLTTIITNFSATNLTRLVELFPFDSTTHITSRTTIFVIAYIRNYIHKGRPSEILCYSMEALTI